MKNKIIKMCNEYNWAFLGETSKGWSVENNSKKGNVISSPTLEGLYNCMKTWIAKENTK